MQSILLVLAIVLAGCSCPGGKEYRSIDGERVNELKAALAKMTPKQIEDLSQEFKFAKEFMPQQVILKFKEGTGPSKVEETLGVLGAFKTYQFKSTKALLLTIPDAVTATDVLAIVTALNEVESVDYASPNGILKVSAVPNDPQYANQDDLANIRAEQAWDTTRGSRDVLVGIIDTGIDYHNPELAENIWTNPGETGTDIEGNDKATNGVDDDANGYVDDVHGYDFINNDNDPMDDYGHGTHVAGTIGARGNNGTGIAGINWRVSLVPLKFIGADGGGSEADAVKAIEYATQMGIHITNNSWGGLGYNQALKDAIEANGKEGFLFVAAAGNNSVDNDSIDFFPANYGLENIISVAAVDNQDNKPDFSNWGARKVDIAAPGVGILSLGVDGISAPYVRMSGTSMAAPHVTGAAALIKAKNPESDFRAMKSRIIYGADQIPQLLSPSYTYENPRRDNYPKDKPLVRGGRRLNLERMLEADLNNPGPIEALRIAFSGLTQLEIRFQKAGDDGTSGEASGYAAVVSSRPITSEDGWKNEKVIDLTQVEVRPSGLLGAEVPDLPFLKSGYLTVRSVDNVGNFGPLSASIPFEMSKPKELFVNDGESAEGINSKDLFFYTVPFLQEEVTGRGKVWSDTPAGVRDYREHTYMEFTQNVEVQHPDVVLQFDTKLDCTAIYERAEVEIRINEETDPFSSYNVWNPEKGAYDYPQSPKWRMLAIYSAPKCEWNKVTIPLRNKLKVGDKIRLRFRFKAGGSVSDGHDGWLIDDIKLLGPGSPEKPTEFIARQETETSPYVLNWKDNSKGETYFEVSSGTFMVKTEMNINRYETGQTTVDAGLRVRACNGTVCSEFSDPVRVMAPPPRISTITPLAGPLAGGNTLSVNGAGFLSGAVIRIQGVDCPNSTRISATQMTCKLPPKEAGTFHVAVVNTDAQKAVLRSAYTYQAAPSILSISPAFGKTSGGETLTINGTGFLAGASVVVGTKSCSGVVVNSSTQLRCTVSENAEGSYNALVRNFDGQASPAVSTAVYRVINPRWVATQGGACSSVCTSVGLASRPSPEGSYCTSGEQIPFSAVGKIPYRNGCWPFRDCRAQGTRSTIQVGQYCYGASQRQDKSKSDVTMGCYCSL